MNYLSEAKRQMVADGIAAGLSDRAIERATGVWRSTVGRYRRHPNFGPFFHREIEALLILRAVRAGAACAWQVQRATGLPRSRLIPLASELKRLGFLCALDGEPWAVGLPASRVKKYERPGICPTEEAGPELRPWALFAGMKIIDRRWRPSDWREDDAQDKILAELEALARGAQV